MQTYEICFVYKFIDDSYLFYLIFFLLFFANEHCLSAQNFTERRSPIRYIFCHETPVMFIYRTNLLKHVDRLHVEKAVNQSLQENSKEVGVSYLLFCFEMFPFGCSVVCYGFVCPL